MSTRGLAIIRNEVIKRLSTRTQSLAPRTGCVAWSVVKRGLVPPIRFAGVRLLSSSAGGDPPKDPLKDPSILAAIEKERAAMLAAKPEKLGRSLLDTVKAHRDELFNMLLAALLLVLTLKMLREKVKMIVQTNACDLNLPACSLLMLSGPAATDVCVLRTPGRKVGRGVRQR